MLFNYQHYQVLLACGKTDMRKNINGLCELVQQHFSFDSRDNIIFAFCNRKRNRIKLLVWQDNGFWIHLKRFEKGRIPWSIVSNTQQTMPLCLEEFESLLKCPDFRQKIKRDEMCKK